MVAMFETVITRCVQNKELDLTEKQIKMIAHNIFVQGQMWGFRRWALHRMYTLEEYIELQTDLILVGIRK
jgi:TetR/AcrR family transcriptional regulator, cholesterol catabolism regulator